MAIPTPFAIEESLVIYDDALSEGWEMSTWDSEVDKAVDTVVHGGQVALGVTPNVYGGIAFSTNLDISEYAYLEFSVNGGLQGGQLLEINIWNAGTGARIAGSFLCRVISSTAALPPDEWFLVRFPLQRLDLANRRVNISIIHSNNQPAPQFFLDNIRLVREAE